MKHWIEQQMAIQEQNKEVEIDYAELIDILNGIDFSEEPDEDVHLEDDYHASYWEA